jgi:hypothetical protein
MEAEEYLSFMDSHDEKSWLEEKTPGGFLDGFLENALHSAVYTPASSARTAREPIQQPIARPSSIPNAQANEDIIDGRKRSFIKIYIDFRYDRYIDFRHDRCYKP